MVRVVRQARAALGHRPGQSGEQTGWNGSAGTTVSRERGFDVDQVALELADSSSSSPSSTAAARARDRRTAPGRDVELLDDLPQAAHALPDGPGTDGSGDQDPLHDRLEPQVEIDVVTGGDADHVGTEVFRRTNRSLHASHRPRSPAQLVRVEHERRTGSR